MPAFLYAEDELCQALGEAVVRYASPETRLVSNRTNGIERLRANMPKYLDLSTKAPVLIVVDLDRVACPLALLDRWGLGGAKPPGFAFRIAVRECESWLMADAQGVADHFGLAAVHLPDDPDSEEDPKRSFLAVLRRRSRGRRELIREMLPTPGASSPVGLGYNAHLRAFIETSWSAERAARRSGSLRRAVERVRTLLS